MVGDTFFRGHTTGHELQSGRGATKLLWSLSDVGVECDSGFCAFVEIGGGRLTECSCRAHGSALGSMIGKRRCVSLARSVRLPQWKELGLLSVVGIFWKMVDQREKIIVVWTVLVTTVLSSAK